MMETVAVNEARPEMGLLRADTPINPVRINRKRYMELAQLAHETCSYLESKGLKKGEQCVFRRIAEELWFAE